MAKLSAKEKKYLRQKNAEIFRNNIKTGDANKEVIPPSQLRQSEVGKGDSDRSNKSKFDEGWDYYEKHRKHRKNRNKKQKNV